MKRDDSRQKQKLKKNEAAHPEKYDAISTRYSVEDPLATDSNFGGPGPEREFFTADSNFNYGLPNNSNFPNYAVQTQQQSSLMPNLNLVDPIAPNSAFRSPGAVQFVPSEFPTVCSGQLPLQPSHLNGQNLGIPFTGMPTEGRCPAHFFNGPPALPNTGAVLSTPTTVFWVGTNSATTTQYWTGCNVPDNYQFSLGFSGQVPVQTMQALRNIQNSSPVPLLHSEASTPPNSPSLVAQQKPQLPPVRIH